MIELKFKNTVGQLSLVTELLVRVSQDSLERGAGIWDPDEITAEGLRHLVPESGWFLDRLAMDPAY